ncbi:MAG: Ig-like domain-containing protein [Patescibacteria group bacterium]
MQRAPHGRTGYYKSLLLATLFISGFFVLFLALPAFAQDRFGVEYGTGTGLSTQDVRITIANIIRYALGVIGIVFLVLIIYGGVTWMTAGGDAQRVEKAKKIITNAVIGLIIIFLAFGIVSFVIGKLEQAVNNGGGGGPAVCGNGICEAGEIVSCPSDCSGLPGGGGAGFNVIATNPNDQQTGVKVCQLVQAQFSANLDRLSVNDTTVNIHPIGGTQITGTYTFSDISFSFHHPEFDRNTSYEATVTTQVQSTAGTNLEREKVWTFTTGSETDSTLPTVATVYPGNGETDVCRDAPIQVTFSEEMDVTTFTVANILLEKQDAAGVWVGVVLVSITPGTDFKSFSAYPAGSFDANTAYRVRLLTGILDNCGNPLDGDGDGIASDYQWSFTTGDTVGCFPIITAVNPGADFYSEQDIVITGNYFFTGAGSDAYFNNFATDTNCFDANYVPNQSCRVSWSMTEIRVRVPVGSTSGPLVVMVGTKSSNSAQFQVQSPYMGGLSPSSGPVSQYVTIGGLQFGSSPGRVEVGGIAADIPPCAAYWTDTSIVIKIPAGLAPGSYPVQVFTAANKASNRLNFMVTTGPLGPGLCSLNPTCGPTGQSVAITGERFGASQGTSLLTFSTLTAAVSSWSDTAIAAAAPTFPSEGGYPVAVTVGGVRSNEIWFTTPCAPGGGSTCNNNGTIDPGEACDGTVPPPNVSCNPPATGTWQCNTSCQLYGCTSPGGTSCDNDGTADPGEQCDGGDLNGITTCTAYSPTFIGGSLACTSGCTYDTSGCLNAADPPQIIENQQCVNSIQSPTPWRDSVDACRNAKISVTFDRDMNESTFAGISTHQCDNSPLCDPNAVGGTWTYLNVGGGREAYIFTPTANLTPDSWYEVTVPTSVISAAGVPLTAPYVWHFGVHPRNSDCTPDTVTVSPSSASIAVGGMQPFAANATASNCNLLTGTYGYQWASSNITQATVTGSATNQETATGVSATGATPVQITSQIQGTSVNGYGELTVTTGPGGTCNNNGTIDPGEACDGTIPPPNVSCNPPATGTWQCNTSCQLYGCTNPGGTSCDNDGTADPGEQCDGGDLNGITTCTAYSPTFIGGSLACSAGCTYDTSGCTGGPGSSCDACGVGRSQLVGGVCTPVITTIQPSTSPVGSWVTIQGCYFGAARGTVTYYNNHPGLWPDPAVCGTNTWTDTQIISEVPNINTADVTDDAQTGPVTITRADGAQATHSSGINVAGSPHPNLCRLTPTSGIIGAAVNVAGNGFGATRQSQDYVSFGATQVPAADYTSWAPTSANVRVPAGAATGDVNVTLTKGTSVSNPLTFNVINNGAGADCDNNPDPAVCAANDSRCNTGLYCDPTSCTCQPASALVVTSFMPTGADICPNAQFSFTFDQLVDHSTVNTNTFFVQEGPPTPCPPPICLTNTVGISLSIEDGDFTAGPQRESRVHITPSRPLALTTTHTFLARGGPNGVKSRYGAELGNPDPGAPYSIGGVTFPAYTAEITTGNHICQIDHVSVTITRGTLTNAYSTISNHDMFTCARNNCTDDVSSAGGNQHTWRAQAWDASSPPQALTGAQYIWAEDDPDSLFELSSLALQEIQSSVTKSKNGSGAFSVGAHDPNPTMGSATTTVSAEVSLCENPWPTFPYYPFVDNGLNFSFWYCRDAGASDTQDDDLPELNNPPVIRTGTGGCADCLKEYLFLRASPDVSKDAIGLRVYANSNKLSLMEWYQTNVKRPGNPSSYTVDGFPAIRDGRSVYVLAPNISGTTFYTNIFLISYNEGASGETISIFNGLVATWKFLINLGPVEQLQVKNDSKRMTDLGGIKKALLDYGKTHGVCNNTSKTPCVVDGVKPEELCPVSIPATGARYICQASYPKLAAGSYLPGKSTSRWPSWQATLGNALGRALPIDPLNAFPHACSSGGKINQACTQDSDCYTCGTTATQCRTDADCPTANPTCNMTQTCVIPNQCPAPQYDQQTCWNDTSKDFDCPNNSRIYTYQTTPTDGLSFTLGANMEHPLLRGTSVVSVAECSMNYKIGPSP